MTTFRVGGPAEWLIETRTSGEVVAALGLAARAGVSVTMLGGGSNVLVSDAGVRGLVIRPRGGGIALEDAGHVRADAAVTINGLVRWTINHGCAGLEAWAGTPGTVGGAVFGNAHFGGRLIGDVITEIRLVTRDGIVSGVPKNEMAFGYDRSRLQDQARCSCPRRFAVSRRGVCAPPTARESLAFGSATQPLESERGLHLSESGSRARRRRAGRDPVVRPARWSIARGVEGRRDRRRARPPAHGNFIVNDGTATAADIRRLIDRCRDQVRHSSASTPDDRFWAWASSRQARPLRTDD